MNKDSIDQVRKILQYWDDGIITSSEFDGLVSDFYLKPMFEHLLAGKSLMQFGSCCCSSHPPTKSFTCEVIIQPHGYTITPIGKVIVHEENSEGLL
jgi:hypothetical protein